jgi:hypothetical protein
VALDRARGPERTPGVASTEPMTETAPVQSRRSAGERPPPTWADRGRVLGWYVATAIVGAAVFPKLAYWARWPTRLGPRGRIAYAAFNALVLFAARELARTLGQKVAELERATDELRRQLGREPTERELFEHLGLVREG